jgi:hypothetical protein
MTDTIDRIALHFVKIAFKIIVRQRELPMISLDAFLAISVALLVAFSISDVIPILSAPLLTPAKKLSQPSPNTARITIATIIHVRIPILHCTMVRPILST